jgi:hypothetical protein
MFEKLPPQWTAQIIASLNLLEFTLLCERYGFSQIFERLTFEGFLDYWERVAPNMTLEDFLNRGRQLVAAAAAQR